LPIVQTGTTKKITITELTGTQVSAAGEVGIGGDTTGVVAGVTVTSKFCVKNEGANPVAGFVHVNDTTANSGSNTFACRSRGTLAAPTVVQNGDSLWNMYIAGNDGTDLALAAEIRVEVDGVPGSNDMPGRILLRTTPDGSQAPVDAVKIDSAQNVTVSAGNLVIGTSGKGIDFSATPGTGTSELLADYEEGTFTPVIAGSTSAGTASYAAQAGTYTKIGRVVYFQVYLSWTSGTGTGDLYVSDLPFLSSTSPFGVASTAFQLDIALSALSYSTGGYVLSSSTSIRLMQNTIAGGAVSSVPYDAAGEFMIAGSYFV
jgi:hypothetical protein